MARERRSTADDTAAVPGQRPEPALPPDAGRDDTGSGGTGPGTAETDAQAAPPEQAQSAPEQAQPPAPATPQDHKIRHTRLSGTWAAVVGFTIVLLLLLIFILQNQHTVEVSYFGAHGHLPLGVSMLLAAVAGILLVSLAGSARIMQLHTTARKHRRTDAKAAKAARR